MTQLCRGWFPQIQLFVCRGKDEEITGIWGHGNHKPQTTNHTTPRPSFYYTNSFTAIRFVAEDPVTRIWAVR